VFFLIPRTGQPRSSRFPTGGTLPAKVTGLEQVGLATDSISMQWAAAAGADTYRVYQKGLLVQQDLAVTEATIDGLTSNTSHDIEVSGFNALGEGPKSDTVTMTTAATEPGIVQYPLIEPFPTSNRLWVSTTGNDSWDRAGALDREDRPLLTLQRAADLALAGDTVIVKDGTYTTTAAYFVNFPRSGTENARIRFISENRWGAILDKQFNSWGHFLFTNGASYITVEGFECKNARHGTVGTQSSSATNTTVSESVILRSNWIHHNGRDRSISVDLGSNTAMGLQLQGWTRYWIIDSNLIHSCTRIPGTVGDAIYDNRFDRGIYGGGFGHLIVNNIFFDHSGGDDISAESTISGPTPPANEYRWRILNNIFATVTNPNPAFHGQIIMNATSGGYLFMNNVHWMDNQNTFWYPIVLRSETHPNQHYINNTTNHDYLIYRRGPGSTDTSSITAQGGVLSNNITNLTNPGIKETSMGLANPTGAETDGELDYLYTSAASVVLERGTSGYFASGLVAVSAPTYDRFGAFRPQNGEYDVGCYEGIGQ